jgi:hypothetical protein
MARRLVGFIFHLQDRRDHLASNRRRLGEVQ